MLYSCCVWTHTGTHENSANKVKSRKRKLKIGKCNMAKNKTDSEELNKNTFHDFYILARDRISQLKKNENVLL